MNRELFELKLLRLKAVFGLREDQEVAALLGISRNSLYVYKSRGRFPVGKLRELAQRSPEHADKVALALEGPVHVDGDDDAESLPSATELLALLDRADKALQGIGGNGVQGRRAEIAQLLEHLNADSVSHVLWFVQRLARADGMDAGLIKAAIVNATGAENEEAPRAGRRQRKGG